MSSVATQVQAAVFREAGTLAATRTIEDGRWVVRVTHGTPVEFDGAGHSVTARTRTTVPGESGVRQVSVNFRFGVVVAVHSPWSTKVSRKPVEASVVPRWTGVGDGEGATVGDGVGDGVGVGVGDGVVDGVGATVGVAVGLGLAADGLADAGAGVSVGPAVGLGVTLALVHAARPMARKIASGPTRRRGRGPIQFFVIVRLASSVAARRA